MADRPTLVSLVEFQKRLSDARWTVLCYYKGHNAKSHHDCSDGGSLRERLSGVQHGFKGLCSAALVMCFLGRHNPLRSAQPHGIKACLFGISVGFTEIIFFFALVLTCLCDTSPTARSTQVKSVMRLL